MALCKLKEHKIWEEKYKNQAEVIIHNKISEVPSQAFEGDKDLRFISLPDGVTKICFRAFKDCTALEKIVIPGTVTFIGDNAFENCESLKAVELAQGLTKIHCQTFNNCKSLEYIRIPEGVTKICSNAFSDCVSLRKVYLPDSLEEISDYAFSNCKNLQIVEGGRSIRRIGEQAFSNCCNLSKFRISSSVKEIAFTAFENCRSEITDNILIKLEEKYVCNNVVNIPDGVVSITEESLSRNERICWDDVVLPDSVKNISYDAFYSFFDFIFEKSSNAQQRLGCLPQKMNMPADYFRQKTQFDAKMAFMLSDTLWKDYVTDEDFEYMLLYQNSQTAQYGACDRLSEDCSYHLSNMLRLTDNSPRQLEHLAAYAASYPKKIDLSLLKALKKRAALNKAHKALDILDKYCFTILRECKDETTYFCLEHFSPYIAERYFCGNDSLNSLISCVRYRDSDKYVPDYLVKCVLAAYIKQIPENIEELVLYKNHGIELDMNEDFCFVKEADFIASQFDEKSFKRVIDGFPIYDYKAVIPICRYGDAEKVNEICDRIVETKEIYSIWQEAAKKALKLCDDEDVQVFLEGVNYSDSCDEDGEFEDDELEEEFEEDAFRVDDDNDEYLL